MAHIEYHTCSECGYEFEVEYDEDGRPFTASGHAPAYREENTAVFELHHVKNGWRECDSSLIVEDIDLEQPPANPKRAWFQILLGWAPDADLTDPRGGIHSEIVCRDGDHRVVKVASEDPWHLHGWLRDVYFGGDDDKAFDLHKHITRTTKYTGPVPPEDPDTVLVIDIEGDLAVATPSSPWIKEI